MAQPEPAFARGGVKGPPSHVLVPVRIGPPPHARVRIPPHAGPPAFLSSMVDVGTGLDFSCALRSDGVAFCWGENLDGQLGDGTGVASAAPVQVASAVAFDRLFVGDEIACGLEVDGTAHCWGGNGAGQLGAGIPAFTPSLVAVPVAAPHQFRDLSLGLRSSCGMALDGLAYCWGNNNVGGLGVGSPAATTTAPLPVLNSAALGLQAVNTSGLTTTCGLDAAGAVYCWGFDGGRFGNGTTVLFSSPTPVAAASGMTFAAVHVSTSYVCGKDVAGAVHCWGPRNISGEMGIGSTAQPVLVPASVIGGLTFASLDEDDTNRSFKSTCGVTPAGAGWCWGANGFGQLGAPSAEHCVVVAPPFTDACSTSPLPVDGGIQFDRIAVGGDHACGLGINGAVYCWGRGHVGQLGDGTLTDRAAPVAVQHR